MSAGATPRQQWTDAVWNALGLTTNEKIVALCYAKYSGRTWPFAWVTLSQLRRNTALRSKSTIITATRGLVDKGWLRPSGGAGLHGQSVKYELCLGGGDRSTTRTGTGPADEPVPVQQVNPNNKGNHEPNHEVENSPSIAATDEEAALPASWLPNATHRRMALDLGLDVEVKAEEFRRRMAGERRGDWEKAFGGFLNACADGREDDLYPHDPCST